MTTTTTTTTTNNNNNNNNNNNSPTTAPFVLPEAFSGAAPSVWYVVLSDSRDLGEVPGEFFSMRHGHAKREAHIVASYPFSHNHGSVENYPKWKETNIGGTHSPLPWLWEEGYDIQKSKLLLIFITIFYIPASLKLPPICLNGCLKTYKSYFR